MKKRVEQKCFFTSDQHFFHRGVIGHCNRPFETVDEMNGALIRNHNALISPNDPVFMLGDFSFAGLEKTIEIVTQLNGRLFWICGNHDGALRGKTTLKPFFEFVGDYLEVEVIDEELGTGIQRIVMSHYPMLTWNRAHYGSWMLHGHSHGTCAYPDKKMRILDVGVDTCNLFPYTYAQIKCHMANRAFCAFDHHTEKTNEQK